MAFLYFGMHNHWAYMINLVRYVVYYVWFTISKLCRLGSICVDLKCLYG